MVQSVVIDGGHDRAISSPPELLELPAEVEQRLLRDAPGVFTPLAQAVFDNPKTQMRRVRSWLGHASRTHGLRPLAAQGESVCAILERLHALPASRRMHLIREACLHADAACPTDPDPGRGGALVALLDRWTSLTETEMC